MAKRLNEDEKLHLQFLVRKIGLKETIDSEFEQAKKLLAHKQIIEVDSTNAITSLWPQTCLMVANLTADEYKACLEDSSN